MAAAVSGLGIDGRMMIVGAAGPIQISPVALLSKKQSMEGWYSGTSIDSQDTLEFSVLTGVRSMNEIFPFDRIGRQLSRIFAHPLS